jgi:hypothetical protein
MGEGRPKGAHALAIIPTASRYNVHLSPVFVAAALDFIGGQAGALPQA